MVDRDDLELRITAFLDGAMEEAEQRAFEAEMEADPALAARVEQMMGNDDLLRAAFAGPIEQGVDAQLLDRMGLSVRAPAAEVVDLSARRAAALPRAANDDVRGWLRWRLPLGGVIAAGLALALMLTVQRDGGATDFSGAMDTLPSGQMASLDNGAKVRPLLTFKAGDGRYCREFALDSGGSGQTGIACTGGAGKWRIEALDKAGAKLGNAGEIELASGARGAGLDAAYERLGASDPLDKAAETALISSKWRKDR
jgi:hypothetical protein